MALIFQENRIFPVHLFFCSAALNQSQLFKGAFFSHLYQCKSKANRVNVTGVKLEEMREELSWVKSNLLFFIFYFFSNLQSRFKMFTNVFEWETGTAHHLSRRRKLRIFFLNSHSSKQMKMDEASRQVHTNKIQEESCIIPSDYKSWLLV